QDLNLNGTISTNEILEENHYYPFGLKHSYTNTAVSDYKYKYNGKEYQDELGLNMYDYGNRNYDPAIGRFHNLDKFSEKYYDMTPYHYTKNNPIFFVEVKGDSIRPSTAFRNSKFNSVHNSLVSNNNSYNRIISKYKNSSNFNVVLDVNNSKVNDESKVALTTYEFGNSKMKKGKMEATDVEADISFKTNADVGLNDLGRVTLIAHEFLHAYAGLNAVKGNDEKHENWDNYLNLMQQVVQEYSNDNGLNLNITQIFELSIFNAGTGASVYDNYLNDLAKKNKTDYETERNALDDRINALTKAN
uniref:RHS repeat-associated core domain-containing protein n=1 Tax=Flavobacterium sp. TaxID=239 RepID=UPI00262633CF